MTDCLFCRLDDPDLEILVEHGQVLFAQSSRYQGALKHSGVIIPRAHRETAFDLSQEEWVATRDLLTEVKAWMDTEFSPAGYNLGWNCEPIGGQTVMHAHLHVIPRFPQEPLAGKGIRALLKSDANRW